MTAYGERKGFNPAVVVRVEERPGALYSCGLLGIGDGEAHLDSSEWIAESSHVTLAFDDLTIPGIVMYSKKKEEGYRTAVSLGSELERNRREPRFPINQRGRITILNAAGTVRSSCTLTDMSRSGLGLTAAEPADPGCMVYVVGGFGMVVGEVRHCRRIKDGLFRIGAETTGVYANVEPPRRLLTFFQKLRWRMAETIMGGSLPGNW